METYVLACASHRHLQMKGRDQEFEVLAPRGCGGSQKQNPKEHLPSSPRSSA